VDLNAHGGREGVAIIAEEPYVAGKSQIPDRATLVHCVTHAVDRAGYTAVDSEDGQTEGETDAIGKVDGSAEMKRDLIGDRSANVVPVRVVDDEGTVSPVTDDADGESASTAEIERIGSEPVASALSGLKSIDRETICGLCARSCGAEQSPR
jgi:hypothetical protein